MAEQEPKSTTSSATELSNDSSLQLLNQVEHCFSDLNLATTDHLLRFIGKNPEGFVPISVVASFMKIKSLQNGHRHLAAILRNSSKLVVSEDGKRVRRLNPITESDMEELQSRIIVAENLPEDRSCKNLMKIFSAVGSVKAIRTCEPDRVASSASRSAKSVNMSYSNKFHAFVEYESVELAKKAVAELNQRSGLRVRFMVKRSAGNRNKRSDENIKKKKKKKKNTTCNDGMDVVSLNYVTPLNRRNRSVKEEPVPVPVPVPDESSKTPPIQASVSPEIQIQMQFRSGNPLSSSTTPSCFTYAAGHHVLSGVTDKRKCRPRGLLAVGPAHHSRSFSNRDSHSIDEASLPLPLPLSSPIHASMHWLRLSPPESYTSTLHSSGSVVTNSSGNSRNVILTPGSDSSSHTYTYIDDLLRSGTGNSFTCELDSLARCLSMTALSPISDPNADSPDFRPLGDTVSVGSSFQFETLTGSYASTDLTHFGKLAGDRESWNSWCSSESGTMISSIYAMDDFDRCRCLSDDDGDNTVDANIFDLQPGVKDKSQRDRDEIDPDEGCPVTSSTDSDRVFVPRKQ